MYYGIHPALAQRIAEYVLRDPLLKPLPDLIVSMLFEIREVVVQKDGILRPHRLPHLFWEVACSFLDRPYPKDEACRQNKLGARLVKEAPLNPSCLFLGKPLRGAPDAADDPGRIHEAFLL